MATEFVETTHAAAAVNNMAPISQLLVEWRHTAEVYADPELHAILSRPHEGDHGPVPPPEAVSPKLGDRAAPPPRTDEYDLHFANTEAAKGWDLLCRQAAGNTRTAFDAIRAEPWPAPSTERQHRLKHDLAAGVHNGNVLEQRQYEVTGGGRVWYLVDRETRTVWLTYAGPGHPKATDR